jgi:hypothetical protein
MYRGDRSVDFGGQIGYRSFMKKIDRQKSALNRLEAQLHPTLVVPLEPNQAWLWAEIIMLRRKLGICNETHEAIARLNGVADRLRSLKHSRTPAP